MHLGVHLRLGQRMTLGANTSLGPFSTAQELSLALNRNELSAEELLMATVERIDAINPTVNAIVAIDVDAARKAARESDQRRAANVVCGPLDGIPMSVKDSSAGLPMGIRIVGPYLEDRTPIHAAELMDDLFGGFVRPPRFEENAQGNRTRESH